MSKFHYGPNGPGDCNANNGRCPFGGESGSDNHFDTREEAEAAYAKAQGGNPPKPLKKATYHRNPGVKPLKPQEEVYATKEEALKAYLSTKGGKSTDANVKKNFSELLNNSTLGDDNGAVSGMDDNFTEAIKSNPEFKKELNGMVESAGYNSEEYHVDAITSTDSLDGGELYNMINFQAQEIDSENYDWDAHDDGEEEDLEQTEKYYKQFLEESKNNKGNSPLNMAEVNYNGQNYTLFMSNNKEDRKGAYGE